MAVFSFEPELEALRPRLGDAVTDALIARERREVFSVHPELRIAGWARRDAPRRRRRACS